MVPTGCTRSSSMAIGHVRLDAGRAQILTRRGNDWTEKYPTIAKSIAGLPAQNAYLDGELCGVLPDGRTAFNLIQNATDTGEGSLVFFLFDRLDLNGENLTALPLVERKTRLASLLNGAPDSLRYNDHQMGNGPAFHRLACNIVWRASSRNASRPKHGGGGRKVQPLPNSPAATV
jgi:bifunctional non-homologous end joining protein LigD